MIHCKDPCNFFLLQHALLLITVFCFTLKGLKTEAYILTTQILQYDDKIQIWLRALLI